MTTDGFVRRARRKQPRSPGGDLALQAPPEIPRAVPANILLRILPVVMVVAMIGMIALFISVGGSAAMRNPMMMMFPMMMLMSMAGMFFGGGRGNGKRAAELNEERKDYLRYLGRMRDDVATTTSDQHDALAWSHPEPEGLLPAIGGDRMWERRPDDSDFCHVRVGVGSQRLATRLSPPDTGPLEDLEPVSMMALRRFIRAHTVTRGMPTAVSLRGFAAIGIEGATDRVHGLVRAMLVQIATMHGPDHVRIAVICADPDAEAWSWLKWVPHALHPTRTDGIGAARMMYRSLGEFDQDHHGDLMERGRWARSAPPTQGRVQWVVVLADGYVAGNEPVISDGGLDSVTVIDVRGAAYELTARKGLQLEIRDTGLLAARTATDSEEFAVADNVSVGLAETIARRMARFRLATAAQLVNLSTTDTENADPGLMRLIGAGDAARIDPSVVWRPRSARERLRVPIGIRRDGSPMELDIKEAAEYGMGPHGLCIGATGSGKSEFLRTLVLSMVTTHSPDALNLVLVDFKGGATFLGLDELPHVAAVITNLEEELSMVDRMRDALAGEMNRRQELLRSAGNFANVGDYEAARRNGADLDPLPALFIVVDEFSELLSQKPDFAELFVMIGRLGRSLHVHLLLASQRLEEGKLRGLDSHLSYRIGLKTFSAAESRAVLGVPDAYHLPSQPGSAFLKSDADDPVRFNASYVSGPYIPGVVEAGGDDGGRASLGGGSLKLFTASPVEADAVPEPTETPAITRASSSTEPLIRDGRTVTLLDMVVSRLVGHGRPAHEVWLPPLDESPAVNSLFPGDDWRSSAFARGSLVVPIGIEDRPYDQRRDVLTVDVSGAAGHVAVVGGPQSGKSTTVRTFILSTAATHTPAEAQFYCLDFGGGTLTGLAGLAHVGSVATRMEDDRVRRTVAEVVTLLRQREARFRDLGIESIRDFRRRKALALAADSDDPILEDEFGDVFLVVDGWGVVRSEFEALEEQLTAVAGQGLSYGIHLVLTASRWMEIRPAVKDLLGTRLELRLGDPGDSEFDRKVAHLVPSGRPGRGLTPDNLHMLVGLPRLDGETDPNTLQDGVADAITQIAAFYGDLAAPAVRMLPERVDRDELSARAWQMHEKNPTSVALGINESELAPVVIDFLAQPHVLAFGDTESGKTALLRTILRGLVENSTPSQTKIVLIDYRRTLLGEVEGNHLAGYASQASTTQTLMTDLAAVLDSRQPGADITPKELRDRSWWEGPEFYVVIDDYDMVALASGNPILPIVDYLAQARDVGLHVILVRRSGGASRALYDPVITRLRDVSAEGLVMSGNKDEGVLLGTTKCCPRPPGQAMMVSRTQGEGLVQIAWTPPREI
ncbi:type VII secretion protein EccCa [Gordonia sp. X0973]|uniref:type VII secretion protein EccCa n=1 Tax=Gordonia sp. X0973 TaxID=2742602 RepID=UPI000F52F30A|nr:type VII secretion protein EccCa [Gordonia sp. X0973]QKT06993.1 type VII secretion protein EccCa [Gordonia sp. X0973]